MIIQGEAWSFQRYVEIHVLGMRLSIERAGILTFHHEGAAFEEVKEKLSWTTPARHQALQIRMRQVPVSEPPSKMRSKPS